MKVTYLGHASFKIEEDGKIVYVDPWLTGPTSPITVDDVDKADIVLVTHDHGDHGYAEALGICKNTGATFVAINELAHKAGSQGVENIHTLNIGGSVNIGGVVVTLVQAFHSSGVGAPTGFIVRFPSGTFYHAGDTGVFASMGLFSELYSPIDVAFLPIGSYFVMSIHQAALATKLLKPRNVIPMHYDTFPVIEANPEKFKHLVSETSPDTNVIIIKPGESTDI
ncbi:MAG: metal-dependent hydrolase [Candidatus Thorarchaeota archaeon]|jgi:L-ascorbate metabolism protein UlaG (beta-lactamase superfamily)